MQTVMASVIPVRYDVVLHYSLFPQVSVLLALEPLSILFVYVTLGSATADCALG